MLDALLSLPDMTLTFGTTRLLRVRALQVRLVESGIDVAVAPDAPERWHLTTAHWIELECEAVAADPPQGLPLLGSTASCEFTARQMRLFASRSRVLAWSLGSREGELVERVVLRLEDWTLEEV